ncbi:MAG: chorismate mutase [Dehalococcoidia bacterium]|jgi:chorismate mutase|uniref:Chorismate mutase n=1 Tax=marine metagenome TaxID=408172 RepID=A0A382JTJ1_9ZZZZ|nr:chorismate mutase [Dehalococcoidia bacterium]MDP6425485.1 chorismate mutase [Dehalococcoidia bacterium]|tara:strand:+ start:148 stop:510 length:363 start_codon:yes stop_codon:yes gene_type:complete
MKIHGVKGAITVQDNSAEAIMQASAELLEELIRRNNINQEDVAAVFFTTSPDLTAEFPARAARERIKWDNVPLMCSHEMHKNGALQKCIRILIMWNTNLMQNEISHAYLRDASILRPDIL